MISSERNIILNSWLFPSGTANVDRGLHCIITPSRCCRCLTSIPNLNCHTLTGQHHSSHTVRTSTSILAHISDAPHRDGGRARVAGFNRYRFAWHPEMNTTHHRSIGASATLLTSCQLLAGMFVDSPSVMSVPRMLQHLALSQDRSRPTCLPP